MTSGPFDNWWFLALGLMVAFVVAVVAALLTRQPPYQPPEGSSIALTVRRHDEALPALATLLAAGIDTDVVEETAKPLVRRLPFRLWAIYPSREPNGPWHVVVPTSALAEAHGLLRGPGS